MVAIHDTPWTQAAVITGLLHLHRRSGRDAWLEPALHLADAQCARQSPDGSFRWAGHEDDRFSSLVHNALADCALLDAAAALGEAGLDPRRERYVRAAETNLEQYIVGALHRPALSGFAVNPVDHYAGRDRFVVNMNAVAAEALAKLDAIRGVTRHEGRIRDVAARILELQARDGVCRGSFAYSDAEPNTHIPLYTALAMRGLAVPARIYGVGAWQEAVREAAGFLDRTQDSLTRLWPHRFERGRLHRFPVFVAGAGMICSGRLDAAELSGEPLDVAAMAGALLRHQAANGALRNFMGYDHPDNGRWLGEGAPSWEDVFPTPNWNAQAFQFLCRVLPAPDLAEPARMRAVSRSSRRFLYVETRRFAVVASGSPLRRAVIAVYAKRARFGLAMRVDALRGVAARLRAAARAVRSRSGGGS